MFRLQHTILFLFISANFFCQDILVKKDSTKTEVKILEIRSTEISYKLFNYTDGPLITVSKSEIACIIYQNGLVERIEQLEKNETGETFSTYDKNRSIDRPVAITPTITLSQKKLSDYIQLNTELGLVVNNAFCNVPKAPKTYSRYQSESEDFSKINTKTCLGYYLAVNFILGKGSICKHMVGLSYLNSTSQYRYDHYSSEYESIYHTVTFTRHLQAEYYSKTHYINLTNGIRFTIGKKINLEAHLSLNVPVASRNQVTGTITESTYKNVPNQSGTSFNNVLDTKKTLPLKETNTKIMAGFALSFMPKISYQLNFKQQKFEISYAYNIASYKYILPWHTVGFVYYPFKKLRSLPDEPKSKSKLIKNPKINLEIGTLFNRGFTNTEENYSGIKPLNTGQYKMGYSLGLNFSHGGSNYFKHIITASFSESKAELHQRTYNYLEDKQAGYKYEYINSTIYNSTLGLLNIGTGIRFSVLKHFNFDNGISFYTPVYSKNQIHANKETKQSNYSGDLISSTTETLENKESSTLLLRKEQWAFFAKMSYEFDIKQTRLGAFINWNYNIKSSAQWFIGGITYYPFKKLR